MVESKLAKKLSCGLVLSAVIKLFLCLPIPTLQRRKGEQALRLPTLRKEAV